MQGRRTFDAGKGSARLRGREGPGRDGKEAAGPAIYGGSIGEGGEKETNPLV